MFKSNKLLIALLLAASPVLVLAQSAVADVVVLEAVVVTPSAHYTPAQWQVRQQQGKVVMLAAVIVTPTARYSAAEWQARREVAAQRQAVVLAPVVVTPQRSYTLAEWQTHRATLQLARLESRKATLSGWLQAVWKHLSFVRSPIEV